MVELLQAGIAFIREFGLPVFLFALLALTIVRSRDSQTRRDNVFTWQFERQAEEIRVLRTKSDEQRDRISALEGKLAEERLTCKERIADLEEKIERMKGGQFS